MQTLTITGASDDLIEVEGAIREESKMPNPRTVTEKEWNAADHILIWQPTDPRHELIPPMRGKILQAYGACIENLVQDIGDQVEDFPFEGVPLGLSVYDGHTEPEGEDDFSFVGEFRPLTKDELELLLAGQPLWISASEGDGSLHDDT